MGNINLLTIGLVVGAFFLGSYVATRSYEKDKVVTWTQVTNYLEELGYTLDEEMFNRVDACVGIRTS